MSAYRVVIERKAAKELTTIDRRNRDQIQKRIADLGENPRPHRVEKLTGREGWRVRSGDYRVIYLIDDEARLVLVTKIDHRSTVYRM